MKPFELIHRILMLIGSCAPSGNETSRLVANSYVLMGIVILLANILGFISVTAYIWKFRTNEIESTFGAAFGTFAFAPGCYIMISSLLFRHKNKHIFEQLQLFFEKCKLMILNELMILHTTYLKIVTIDISSR